MGKLCQETPLMISYPLQESIRLLLDRVELDVVRMLRLVQVEANPGDAWRVAEPQLQSLRATLQRIKLANELALQVVFDVNLHTHSDPHHSVSSVTSTIHTPSGNNNAATKKKKVDTSD